MYRAPAVGDVGGADKRDLTRMELMSENTSGGVRLVTCQPAPSQTNQIVSPAPVRAPARTLLPSMSIVWLETDWNFTRFVVVVPEC